MYTFLPSSPTSSTAFVVKQLIFFSCLHWLWESPRLSSVYPRKHRILFQLLLLRQRNWVQKTCLKCSSRARLLAHECSLIIIEYLRSLYFCTTDGMIIFFSSLSYYSIYSFREIIFCCCCCSFRLWLIYYFCYAIWIWSMELEVSMKTNEGRKKKTEEIYWWWPHNVVPLYW